MAFMVFVLLAIYFTFTLACVSYSDIQYLGYFQLFIGSVSLFFSIWMVFGPLFWNLHIVYGTLC
jgi:hypothetical protein